jgi:hypothetical protein
MRGRVPSWLALAAFLVPLGASRATAGSPDGCDPKPPVAGPASGSLPVDPMAETAEPRRDPMGEADAGSSDDPMTAAAAKTTANPPRSDRRTMQANPSPVVVTQPDGSKVALRLYGNVRLNWQTDMNGYPVVRKSNGQYVYATLDPQGRLKPTDRVVGKVDAAASGIKKEQPKAPPERPEPPAPAPDDKPKAAPSGDPMGDLPCSSPTEVTPDPQKLPEPVFAAPVKSEG